jgi:hypothetical protein
MVALCLVLRRRRRPLLAKSRRAARNRKWIIDCRRQCVCGAVTPPARTQSGVAGASTSLGTPRQLDARRPAPLVSGVKSVPCRGGQPGRLGSRPLLLSCRAGRLEKDFAGAAATSHSRRCQFSAERTSKSSSLLRRRRARAHGRVPDSRTPACRRCFVWGRRRPEVWTRARRRALVDF